MRGLQPRARAASPTTTASWSPTATAPSSSRPRAAAGRPRRSPDGARSISNGLTIPGFADAYADKLRGRVAGCTVRRGLTERRAAEADGVLDAMAVLRDNGTGGGPRWSPVTGSMTGPNMHGGGLVASSQTVASWVGDPASGTHWATGTAEPALSLFVPLRVHEPLDEQAYPVAGVDNTADQRSLWWRHERLHRLALRDWVAAEAHIAPERDRIESGWVADPPATADAVAVAAEQADAWQRVADRPRPGRDPAVVGAAPLGRLRPGRRTGEEHMSDTEVIVVGAGLAGLAAARAVAAAGRSVRVLEARSRVGGRTELGHLADGQTIDLGGQWVGPGHDRMYALVEELGLSTFPTYNEGDTVFSLGGRTGRLAPTKGAVPRLNPFALADLAQGTARFGRLARSVDLDAPWRTRRADDLDGQTFRTWVRRNLRTPQGRAYFELYCQAVLAAELADVSLLHALFYTRSGTDMDTLAAVDRGAQQDRILGGSALVSERMAESLGAAVTLDAPVRRVAQDDAGVTVTTRDGRDFTARRVIVTLPPALAGRLEYAPLLPPWRDQLTQKTPAGSVLKLYAVYDEPFWRADGLNGQAASDEGPVKVTFDNTPPGYDGAIMMGFIEGNHARSWSRRTPEERRAAFVDCLVRYFGPRAASPREYAERDWTAEEFSRGCYGAHFAPGVWTGFGPALREPVGRLHWAGTECAPVWNGYMEGAVRSGEATAAEVLLAGLGV